MPSALLTNGTIGCGSIVAVDVNGTLLDAGDGETEEIITHENASANLIEMVGDVYGI